MDTGSIVELARLLIRTPSQAGIDDPAAILAVLLRWFSQRGLPARLLCDSSGQALALYAETGSDGPRYLLDACIDTAAAGNRESWHADPFGAEIRDGWLYGRGAGDSKTAVSIFSHIFEEFHKDGGPVRGRLGVLFDADEHTGRFGGLKTFTAEGGQTSGVYIGYPGFDEAVIGARGFYRAEVRIPGTAAHTGMPAGADDNAARKAAAWITRLYRRWEAWTETVIPDENFPFGPALTVTGVQSGTGFSVVPDLCTIMIDTRLTRTCGAEEIRGFLEEVCRSEPGAVLREVDSQPAYTLPRDSTLASALRSAAQEIKGGESLPLVYCGPSNIGNSLAAAGIPAVCGFGAVCEGFHAADERIRLDTVEPVARIYRRTVQTLIG
jgi:succinyl-diaminopimelate desuccinylase